MKRFLIVIAVFTLGCQDHHFVPIEKADEKDFPKPPALMEELSGAGGEAKRASPAFRDTGERAKKQVMTGKYQSGVGYAKKTILEGVLELGGEAVGGDYSDHTVYVLAWNPLKKGPPVAVGRFLKVKFPYEFRLDEGDIMVPGGDLVPGLQLAVEARLDSDGDVVTREKGDIYGLSEGAVRIGSSDVRVVLNRIR